MINSSKKLGKVLYSYEPEVKYKKNDLLNFLKNVNLRDMLVKIGNISIELMRNENNTLLLNNVIPINHYIINISIEYAFKYCSCDLNDEIVDKDLFNFYDMCYCVSNDFKLDDDIDPMTYYSYKQLHYQQKILNQISRTYIIYSKLWDNNLEAKVSELYNIQKVIISEIGLDLRKILYLSILVTSKKNSFFNISELKNYIKENISKFNIEISNKNIIDYLDWISTPIHSINFNNSLDPLIQKPIVCSDTL